MKLWYGYGSEHSMNLVMIGHFADVESAAETKRIFEQLEAHVSSELASDTTKLGGHPERYSSQMLELLERLQFYTATPSELEQFGYDFHVELRDSDLVLTTEETEISAFLKLLLSKSARVEVFSAHDYPHSGYGRGIG